MVTFAKAIYDTNSNIIAVLGIDISIKNIQDEILRVHFLETGYAILCESASRDSSKSQERVVVSAKFSKAGEWRKSVAERRNP